MAHIKKGITGALSGSISGLTGYQQKGKPVIRSKKASHKLPINSIQSEKAANLKEIKNLYSIMQPYFTQLLEVDHPDLELTWPIVSASLLKLNDFSVQGQLSPILLGQNEFTSNQKFLGADPGSGAYVALTIERALSLKALYPDVTINIRHITTVRGISAKQTFSNSLNNWQYRNIRLDPGSNYTQAFVFWYYSALHNLRSKVAVVGRHDF